MTVDNGELGETIECAEGSAGTGGGGEELGMLKEEEDVGASEEAEEEKRSNPKTDKRPSSGNLGLDESRLSSSPDCSCLVSATSSPIWVSFTAFSWEWPDPKALSCCAPALFSSSGASAAE